MLLMLLFYVSEVLATTIATPAFLNGYSCLPAEQNPISRDIMRKELQLPCTKLVKVHTAHPSGSIGSPSYVSFLSCCRRASPRQADCNVTADARSASPLACASLREVHANLRPAAGFLSLSCGVHGTFGHALQGPSPEAC
jgi:hypothetical protein